MRPHPPHGPPAKRRPHSPAPRRHLPQMDALLGPFLGWPTLAGSARVGSCGFFWGGLPFALCAKGGHSSLAHTKSILSIPGFPTCANQPRGQDNLANCEIKIGAQKYDGVPHPSGLKGAGVDFDPLLILRAPSLCAVLRAQCSVKTRQALSMTQSPARPQNSLRQFL